MKLYENTKENVKQLYDWCVETYPNHKFKKEEDGIYVTVDKVRYKLAEFTWGVSTIDHMVHCMVYYIAINKHPITIHEKYGFSISTLLEQQDTKDFAQAKKLVNKFISCVEKYKPMKEKLRKAQDEYMRTFNSIKKEF